MWLESQLSRMNCRMFSTGLSSRHLAGSGMMLIFWGMMPVLSATDAVTHVIVGATLRDATEDPEPMPVGIKQHLMGLQQISPDQKGSAVRQLNVGNLQLRPLATQDRKILAPIELECLARPKRQGHEDAAPCRLLIPLPIGPPVTRKCGDPVVGAIKSENHQIRMHLLQRSPLLARLAGLRLQSAGQLLSGGIERALSLRCRELQLDRACAQILLDRVAWHPGPSRDLAQGQLLAQSYTSDDV